VEEVDAKMASLGRKKVRSDVVAQLKFRRHVLKTKNKDNLLSLSSNGKQILADQLVSNLKKVITNANNEVDQILNNNNNNTYEPLPQHLLIAEKRKFQELVQKEQEKGAKKRKTTHSKFSAGQDVPSIQDPDDLVGKWVEHLSVAEDGKKWYPGIVTVLS
jgi:hypothetical protein